jgi:predicted MFS family arabinose efflux permease
MLSSALSLTWAISGIFIGAWSDRVGKKKIFIVVAGLLFSLCSVLSGLATGFLMLLGARLLMGATEGAVMPISHSLVAEEVSPEHRGLAMGVNQNLGSNFLGSTMAPLVLTALAAVVGWRSSFFLAGAPGLLFAALIWFFVKEPEKKPQAHGDRLTMAQALQHKNMVLCVLISILLVSYLVVTWAFMPTYLVNTKGMSPQDGSFLMAALGISATVGAFVTPAISDKVGRRPVMILIPFLGLLIPFSVMYMTGTTWTFMPFFFFGWALNGIFPMFMATIPSETLPARYVATATGITMGLGEVIGGVLSPTIAGWANDHFHTPNATMWILAGLAVVAGILGMGLDETAPGKRKTPAPDAPELEAAPAQ